MLVCVLVRVLVRVCSCVQGEAERRLARAVAERSGSRLSQRSEWGGWDVCKQCTQAVYASGVGDRVGA